MARAGLICVLHCGRNRVVDAILLGAHRGGADDGAVLGGDYSVGCPGGFGARCCYYFDRSRGESRLWSRLPPAGRGRLNRNSYTCSAGGVKKVLM